MGKNPSKTERIYSLDYLRAVMMLLVVICHSSLTYSIRPYLPMTWALKDSSALHIFNDYLTALIPFFCIQIFFVVAGFFASLLFYERSPKKMILNRIKRILYPFIVFLLILWPIIAFFWIYTPMILSGTEDSFGKTLNIVKTPYILIPLNTGHLWFLYYLFVLSCFTGSIAFIMRFFPLITRFVTSGFNWMIQRPLFRILFLSTLMSIIYLVRGKLSMEAPIAYFPNLNTFVYYLFFFIFGWILFKSQYLLDNIMKFDWVNLILGLTLFSIGFVMDKSYSFEVLLILKSLSHWLFVFGITGLFLRYANNHSSVMQYISDSSYWVYLVHLPFTLIVPALIANWPINGILKFLIVALTTLGICFLSYHYLVRGKFIDKFLNGRK